MKTMKMTDAISMEKLGLTMAGLNEWAEEARNDGYRGILVALDNNGIMYALPVTSFELSHHTTVAIF